MPASYLTCINKLILKFIWRGKDEESNPMLKLKNNYGNMSAFEVREYLFTGQAVPILSATMYAIACIHKNAWGSFLYYVLNGHGSAAC
jgi:hypothetical protein